MTHEEMLNLAREKRKQMVEQEDKLNRIKSLVDSLQPRNFTILKFTEFINTLKEIVNG